jgi:hypothetical protein
MLALHAATLHAVSVIVTLVCAGVSLLTWYHHREGPGLRGWTLALLLGSVAAFLYSLRGPDTPFRLILISDSLAIAGFATMWVSMRRFNDLQLGVELMATLVVATTIVFAILFTLAWQIAPVARAHSVVFSLFVFMLMLAAAWETWRGRRLDGLRSRSIAALALAGIAAARLIRGTIVVLEAGGMVDAAFRQVSQGYTLYFTTVCILVVTFGLVLMANERYERQYAQSTEERPAAE